MKKNSVITLLYIGIITFIFLLSRCPLDKWIYLGSGMFAVGLMILAYRQVKKIENLHQILDIKILEYKKKGGV